jgi:putative SOS response-associated peptidase YedK
MPVILESEDFDLWLHTGEQRVERLRELLKPAAARVLTMHPVSSFVNKASNEGERCEEPAEEAPSG